MKPRLLAVLWLLLGFALWNGIFDLYVSRGAREYLQRQAEFELGRGPEPAMNVIMARNQEAGVWAATAWTGLVVIAGWATILLVGRAKPNRV